MLQSPTRQPALGQGCSCSKQAISASLGLEQSESRRTGHSQRMRNSSGRETDAWACSNGHPTLLHTIKALRSIQCNWVIALLGTVIANASNALPCLAHEFSLFLTLPGTLPWSWAAYPVQHPKVGCELYQVVLLCDFFRLVLSPRQGTHLNQMPCKFIIFWEQEGPEETCCTRPGQGNSQPRCEVV